MFFRLQLWWIHKYNTQGMVQWNFSGIMYEVSKIAFKTKLRIKIRKKILFVIKEILIYVYIHK